MVILRPVSPVREERRRTVTPPRRRHPRVALAPPFLGFRGLSGMGSKSSVVSPGNGWILYGSFRSTRLRDGTERIDGGCRQEAPSRVF
jgi:hypothetical protein